MLTRPIGSTGVEIPSIVFGTSSLGNLYRAIDDEAKRAIVGEILTHCPGTIALDSAGKYGAGMALEVLGRSLRTFNVPQSRVVVSNKLGWRRVPLRDKEPTFEPGVWVDLDHDAVQDISYDGIMRCWEEGEELLGDYPAQLLSVHDPDEYLAASDSAVHRELRWGDIIDAYRALGELKSHGKARAIGVGAKDWRVVERLVEVCEFDWVMLAGSYTVYRHEREVVEFIDKLHRRGIAVINSALFHGGFLTGGEFFDYHPVNNRSEQGAALNAWRERFQVVCNRFGTTPAAASVCFGMSPPGVVAVALNTSRPEKVRVNVQLAQAQLGDAFWDAMRDAGLMDRASSA